ncbi:FIG081498: hypothetical protein [hydrothermal vent metagenome]|uniref:TIGR04219 family outer membrane beta-barrel protein n=1 Tax=hydrothermal vent metagenome TaxID=652676 RepID=A0A3B1E5S4_9ZZZZ
MIKKILLNALSVVLLSSTVNADFLGAEAGYAVWLPKFTGTIKGSGNLDADINAEDELGFGDTTTNIFVWAYFDHPMPLLPNIKIIKTNYTDEANTNTNIVFGNKSYTSNAKTSLTLDQLDIIGYYRLLDNWVNLDLGFNFKFIDGVFKISNNNSNIDKEFNLVLPALYAKARADLPFSGLSVEADGSYIGYSGNKITDIKFGISYDVFYGLGLNAGYRIQKLTLNDVDNINTMIDINGMYAGLFYHF